MSLSSAFNSGDLKFIQEHVKDNQLLDTYDQYSKLAYEQKRDYVIMWIIHKMKSLDIKFSVIDGFNIACKIGNSVMVRFLYEISTEGNLEIDNVEKLMIDACYESVDIAKFIYSLDKSKIEMPPYEFSHLSYIGNIEEIDWIFKTFDCYPQKKYIIDMIENACGRNYINIISYLHINRSNYFDYKPTTLKDVSIEVLKFMYSLKRKNINENLLKIAEKENRIEFLQYVNEVNTPMGLSRPNSPNDERPPAK